MRATEQDRLESWLCDQTAAVPGSAPYFVFSSRRRLALSAKASDMAHSTDDDKGTMPILEKCFGGDAPTATLRFVR